MGIIVILIILSLIWGACSDDPQDKKQAEDNTIKGVNIIFRNLFR